MMKKFRFILSVGIICLFGIPSCKGESQEKDEIKEEVKEETNINPEIGAHVKPGFVRNIKVRNIGPLWQVFNDSNYLQLKAAMEMGIDPVNDLSSAYFMKRPIVKIHSNEYYHIDTLRHSLPYLVPEAARLLEDIGKNFTDSLEKRGGDSYIVKVTSVLRTPESVNRLRRVNVNATDSSTHQYATTFDLSYTNFYCLDEDRQIFQGDLKNLLAEVLQDLRQQERCYVKYENKTSCFHITVRK